jgi:hypothetical protein
MKGLAIEKAKPEFIFLAKSYLAAMPWRVVSG